MVFSSITFIFFFLPIALLAYYSLVPLRNLTLFLLSLFFYTWGEVEFLFLLLLSISGNYLSGLWIGRYPQQKMGAVALGVGICFNLFLLISFKYAHFLIGALNLFWTLPGFPPLELESIHLPLGISFFTFQAISYLVDVYRRDAPLERRPLTVALYIAMFPQLIAGPIVRFKEIVEQLHRRIHSLDKFATGIRWFSIGLGMKVVIANTLSGPADSIFGLATRDLNASLAWLGAISYSLQIYFDFAGYSSMAIGLGLMLGFHLPQNFDYPYRARSISEFWRRWHITLSQWFRDYLYIPLGGSRGGRKRTFFNLLLVFLLCGLWHGAAWNFLLWGLFHGLFLIAERLVPILKEGDRWKPLRHLYTLAAVLAGWVMFRCDSLDHTFAFWAALVGQGTGDGQAHHVGQFLRTDVLIALIGGALVSTDLLKKAWARFTSRSRRSFPGFNRALGLGSWLQNVAIFLLFLLSTLMLSTGTNNPFIYFRF
ncbi:MBOAT family protein [bacterium]|nr:MBOAT family protein [bacterium]